MKYAICTNEPILALSAQAVARMAWYIGRPSHFYRMAMEADDQRPHGTLIPLANWQHAEVAWQWVAFDCHVSTQLTIKEAIENFPDHHLSQFPEDRSNPYLIRVIEELGRDAGGRGGYDLKIVNVPDDALVEVVARSGRERVQELGRVWE